MYARDTALIATPIGTIRIEGNDRVIMSVSILNKRMSPRRANAVPVETAGEQIQRWFAGDQYDFDLPLTPAATVRGEALRAGIAAIAYGDTISYGALARAIRSSARAIGQACARNPFPIIVPCHRVLNANGSLGAYSAGDGPTTKHWLLDHERRRQIN